MTELITFKAPMPIRCNRCDGKFNSEKDLQGHLVGNGKVYRLVDFHNCPLCGMTDCHYVYKVDIGEL